MSKTTDQPATLSEYWNPPYFGSSRIEAGEPIACLATTYEFDAQFFEVALLPRFLELQFDAGMYHPGKLSLSELEDRLASTPVAVLVEASKVDPSRSTLRWEQIPVEVPGGVQHSKIAVLAWEHAIRLLVGSANLTRSGYKRNREIFAALDFFDDGGSAPRKVLIDALRFLEVVLGWARVPEKIRCRVEGTISGLRTRIRGWKKAPLEGSQKGFPRVFFVSGHPGTGKESAKSVLARLAKIAGHQKVLELVIMTPFVSSSQKLSDPVLNCLLEKLPSGSDTVGWLIAPQRDSGISRRKTVALPKAFGHLWKEKFGDRARIIAVPDLRDEGIRRELHAKAVLFERAKSDVLMMGSSNFTAHGMGVGTCNCEANLVFLDRADEKREDLLLYERLGADLDWRRFGSPEDFEWATSVEDIEDSESEVRLPPFFRWATLSNGGKRLTVELDRESDEPVNWQVWLAGSQSGSPIFSRRNSPIQNGKLSIELPNGPLPSALRICWRDSGFGSWKEGFMVVSVEDPVEDLPPPSASAELTLNERLECLLSGRSIADWVDNQKDGPAGKKQLGKKKSDALAMVDTTGYLLYRVRRFGGALTRLAEKIRQTPCIPAKIQARLLLDPLGPIQIATAIREECLQNKCLSDQEYAYRIFMLAEILLLLKHASTGMKSMPGGA